MNKRYGNIEVLRFLFSVCIVLHHAMIPWISMWGGYLSVEFFYILSGFFLANYVNLHKEYDIELIYKSNIQYCIKRYKSIIVYFVISTAIGCIVLGYTYEWKFDFERIMYIFSDFIFVQSMGLPVASITGIVWYLSSMFIGLLIVYPLAMKNGKVYFKYIAPFISILGSGILIYNYGSLNAPADYLFGVICTGNIRSVCMISLGLFVNMLSVKLEKLLNTKNKIFIASIVELMLYMYIFFYMHIWTEETGKFDYITVLAMVISLGISMSGKSMWMKVFNNDFSRFLGRYSMTLFLSHFYWVQNIDQIVDKYVKNIVYLTEFETKTLGIFLSGITAFIVLGMGDLTNKIFRMCNINKQKNSMEK